MCVVTLNSNTAHDAILYRRPVITLGRGVWSTKTGAFWVDESLPKAKMWDRFVKWAKSDYRENATTHYVHHLMKTQWNLGRAVDAEDVTALINECADNWIGQKVPETGKKRAVVAPAEKNAPAVEVVNAPTVNVVALNKGWLFEDLKAHLVKNAETVGCRAVVTEQPVDGADAYLYMRPEEANGSPAPDRTVCQVHDLFGNRQSRFSACKNIAGWSMVNPDQLDQLRGACAGLPGKHVMCLPIGAPAHYRPAGEPRNEAEFRVGWVGRNSRLKGTKTYARGVAKCLYRIPGIKAVVVGDNVEDIRDQLMHWDVPCECIQKREIGYAGYLAMYQSLDCLVICSETESQPLPLFEALRCGVPVCSTPVGLAQRYIREGDNGFIYKIGDAQALAMCLKHVYNDRKGFRERRHTISECTVASVGR